MRAIVLTEYGPPGVLQLRQVEQPVPRDHEVLIKIHATPVNFGDLTARNFKAIPLSKFTMPAPLWVLSRLYFGWSKPKISILGSEFSGIVHKVGKNVSRYKKGDAVFGYLGQRMGANADYICMPEKASLALKPATMTDEQAATLPYGSLMALNLLKKVTIKAGEKVLINGASGGIGAMAVQLAKHSGAHVTGVCGSQRMEMVRSLGADRVIDYSKEDFTTTGETFDVIVDILGKGSFSHAKRALSENGRYLYVSFKTKQLVQMLRTSMSRGRKVICALASENPQDLALIKELAETGKIKTVIDKIFSLEQAADAHRYAEQGQKTGHIVLRLTGPDPATGKKQERTL